MASMLVDTALAAANCCPALYGSVLWWRQAHKTYTRQRLSTNRHWLYIVVGGGIRWDLPTRLKWCAWWWSLERDRGKWLRMKDSWKLIFRESDSHRSVYKMEFIVVIWIFTWQTRVGVVVSARTCSAASISQYHLSIATHTHTHTYWPRVVWSKIIY